MNKNLRGKPSRLGSTFASLKQGIRWIVFFSQRRKRRGIIPVLRKSVTEANAKISSFPPNS